MKPRLHSRNQESLTLSEHLFGFLFGLLQSSVKCIQRESLLHPHSRQEQENYGPEPYSLEKGQVLSQRNGFPRLGPHSLGQGCTLRKDKLVQQWCLFFSADGCERKMRQRNEAAEGPFNTL